jgi:thioredoxin reductase (NADPH)
MIHDLVIVGSGPAGYTAAIYAARAQLSPVLYEGSVTAGGALMTTTEVENFPGFVDGVMGPELMESMRKQAARFGTELITDDVVEMDLTGEIKSVRDGSGNVVQARAVILATGSAYRHIGLANEERLSGRGVSWCATCDGFFFRDQTIAVVGGGDSANNPKIEMLWNTEVVDILGENKVEALALKNTVTGELSQRDFTGLFVAIGHIPRSELLLGQIDCDNEGYVKVEGRSTRTNLSGVFACGDLVDHTYRQAITAAGSGCQAALDAEKFLSH